LKWKRVKRAPRKLPLLLDARALIPRATGTTPYLHHPWSTIDAEYRLTHRDATG
jgi:hypothetical protein|tara:strand:- start:1131 stop:1292 length:162 start_codon:yes stop_codon:yes gene_type:complete